MVSRFVDWETVMLLLVYLIIRQQDVFTPYFTAMIVEQNQLSLSQSTLILSIKLSIVLSRLVVFVSSNSFSKKRHPMDMLHSDLGIILRRRQLQWFDERYKYKTSFAVSQLFLIMRKHYLTNLYSTPKVNVLTLGNNSNFLIHRVVSCTRTHFFFKQNCRHTQTILLGWSTFNYNSFHLVSFFGAMQQKCAFVGCIETFM